MLSDEQLWDANAAGVIVYQSTHHGLQYAAEGEALAGLRAVEAAVRADQIEKDAGIAQSLSDVTGATADRMLNERNYDDSSRYSLYAIAYSAAAVKIRAQLSAAAAIVSASSTPEQEADRG